MKQILKDIIEDQKSFLQKKDHIPRVFDENIIHSEQIVIITGIRRCGKSVLLQQIRKKCKQRDYFFNFDDDRLSSFTQENFQDLYEVFIELYGQQDYFFFDEIQNIKGWEHFVKRLYNQGKKIFITGSNANMLSKELGTLLTGCYISIELYPFSFAEFLSFNHEKTLVRNYNGTKSKAKVQSYFEKYLLMGGFPLYLRNEDNLILKTLYDNILYRDIMVRNQITNEKELKEMVFFIISNIGKPLTYTSLAKVINIKNSTTIKTYLDYIENTYLLFSISKYDVSLKAQIRNPKKIYCIDTALSLQLGFRVGKDIGRMLENLVFIELKRRGKEIFYYNNNACECDFVTREGFRITNAFQVCYDMSDKLTEQREIEGLYAALQEFSLQEGFIITDSRNETITYKDKTIHILPCWQWLL